MIPRLLLFAAPLLFAAQYWVVWTRCEPYPAVILPGFGFAPPPQPQPVVLLLRDGETIGRCSFDEFLPDFQRQYRMSIPATFLRREPSPAVREWLAERAERIDPRADAAVVQWSE